MTTLTIEELEQVFKSLVTYIKWCGYDKISFSKEADYYLRISYKDRTIIYDDKLMKCPPYMIGSLSDDIEGLKNLLNGEHEFPTSLDLERFGTILTIFGETMEIQESKFLKSDKN